jgi:hypothetical protein
MLYRAKADWLIAGVTAASDRLDHEAAQQLAAGKDVQREMGGRARGGHSSW